MITKGHVHQGVRCFAPPGANLYDKDVNLAGALAKERKQEVL